MRPSLDFVRKRIQTIGQVAMSAYRWLGKGMRFPIPNYTRWGLYPQALVLVVCYSYWKLFQIIPGVSIAALGFAAVIMTVRAEKFSHTERVVWVFLGFLLMVVEVRTLYQDRQDSDQRNRVEDAREEAKFETTLHAFEVQERQAQALLKTTQTTANLAKENLENVTGGDSYLYYQISSIAGPYKVNETQTSGSMYAATLPIVVGKFPLRGIYVEYHGPTGWMEPDLTYETFLPHEIARKRDGKGLLFPADKSPQKFRIYINASNGSYEQDILFVEVKEKWTWASWLYKAQGKKPPKVPIGKWYAQDFPKEDYESEWAK